MEQLIMRWTNDGTPAETVTLPEDVALVRFPELPNALGEWLAIVENGLTGPCPTEELYRGWMTDKPHYTEDLCFFLLVSGEPAATFTVIADPDTKEGYLHMVGSKPAFRGRGLGTLMNRLSVAELKRLGMRSAYLDTDDFRIPAIRGYLRAGFVPEENTPELHARWEAIRRVIAEGK